MLGLLIFQFKSDNDSAQVKAGESVQVKVQPKSPPKMLLLQ